MLRFLPDNTNQPLELSKQGCSAHVESFTPQTGLSKPVRFVPINRSCLVSREITVPMLTVLNSEIMSLYWPITHIP